MDQLFAILAKMDTNAQEMNANMQAMKENINENACKMNDKMDENMQTLRGEMQSMGLNLQAGQKAIVAIARRETRTTEHKMAAPRGRDTEPAKGSVDCVGPRMETGEVTIIRKTCWARLVKVTEKVTVTEREKLNGVTETCTRHVETRETQELKEITETQEIEGELDETKDEHTHTHGVSEGQ